MKDNKLIEFISDEDVDKLNQMYEQLFLNNSIGSEAKEDLERWTKNVVQAAQQVPMIQRGYRDYLLRLATTIETLIYVIRWCSNQNSAKNPVELKRSASNNPVELKLVALMHAKSYVREKLDIGCTPALKQKWPETVGVFVEDINRYRAEVITYWQKAADNSGMTLREYLVYHQNWRLMAGASNLPVHVQHLSNLIDRHFSCRERQVLLHLDVMSASDVQTRKLQVIDFFACYALDRFVELVSPIRESHIDSVELSFKRGTNVTRINVMKD